MFAKPGLGFIFLGISILVFGVIAALNHEALMMPEMEPSLSDANQGEAYYVDSDDDQSQDSED